MLEASGVELVEDELDGVCEDWLLISEELLLGVVLEEAASGVVLVEDCDCEDCVPHLELEDEELSGEVLELLEGEADEELLVCGLLLEVESGVEVLPVAPVVLWVLELLPTLLEPVCALLLADVSGVVDCEPMLLEAEFGDELLASGVELELFGDELLLFGLLGVELLLGEVVELELGEVEVDELDELPEMLPAVFWSDGVADAAPAPAAEATVSSLSSTFLTPATDLASFLASFLSSLLATVPLNLALPFSTEICTP